MLLLMGGLLALDVLLIAACAHKFLDGAWFPLAVGALVLFFMATWSRGSELLFASIRAETPAVRPFVATLAGEAMPRAARHVEDKGRAVEGEAKNWRQSLPATQRMDGRAHGRMNGWMAQAA